MKTTQKIKWRDVRKELPEEGQVVFCVQDPSKTATRKPLISVFEEGNFRTPYLNEWDEIKPLSNAISWSDIIYWMPLFPLTPKQLSDMERERWNNGEIELKK
jgi:hypothetical protein